jgi:uncharacterized iron-regulated membrane protein
MSKSAFITSLEDGKKMSSLRAGIHRRLLMKKLHKFLGIIVLGIIIAIGLAGCESTDWAVVADSLSAANNQFANAYSSTSSTGMVYTIYNRSSVAVVVYDATGAVYIPAGSTVSARFNSDATIYDVYYDSESPVSVTQSGYSFTFRN